MKPLLGAGVMNFLEDAVILKHLNPNLGFNASGSAFLRSVMYDLTFLKSSKYLRTFSASGSFLSQGAYKRARPARISGVLVGALFKLGEDMEEGDEVL
eukprot:jgi/Tetstr1/437709/TSEL_026364.t1